MNLKQLIADCNAKMAELRNKIDTATTPEQVEAITAECEKVKATRAGYIEQMQAEARSLFEAPESKPLSIPSNKPETSEREKELNGLSKRGKIAYCLGKQVRGGVFDEIEKRALGSALTTTAETYVAASSSANGVNNAGVFISTSLLFDFLREDQKLSPLVNDIQFTSIKGLTKFVFRKSRDKAKGKAEGVDGKDNQMEWDTFEGTKGYLQTIIVVTDEVMALSDLDLGSYIMGQILQDINEDWAGDLIYGNATDEKIKGVTYGATAAVTGGYESNKVIDALIAGIKKCKGSYRRGAKIYLAQDVYDEIIFSTDDNGNFKYPIFNNATGVTSLGSIRTEVDENLNEGDFIIGNVGKYFKANALIPLRLETNRLARKGATEYIASEYCCTTPKASAFVYGQKKI